MDGPYKLPRARTGASWRPSRNHRTERREAARAGDDELRGRAWDRHAREDDHDPKPPEEGGP